ncbi:PAS domain S-box-containing protein [Sphaerotilus hippei]|uniref:histidine kinase n=1 Tax=Sphaerotilus hippei TaxID=744406 RepID=A0A318GXW2_9BURK|nr:PAS domain S-box protein [Sphaerotilus hippei]PXW94154.1 PAS domain S-box-containing protein [Sphaerotilus hippei]
MSTGLMPNAAAPVSLATRLASGARYLVTCVVLLVGGLSLAMIGWLLLQRADARLNSAGGEIHLLMETRLDNAAAGLAELSRRTLVRNALVDPAGRDVYLAPTLSEHQKNSLGVQMLWLTDHEGRTLADSHGELHGAGQPEPSPPEVRDLAIRSMLAGHLQQQLHQEAGRWRLLLAYPVVFASTGTVEGTLVGELDLGALLQAPLAALTKDFRAEVRSGQDLLAMTAPRSGNELSASWSVQMRTRIGGVSQAFMLDVHQPVLTALAPVLWIGALYAMVGAALLWIAHRGVERLANGAMRPLQALQEAAHRVARDGLDQIPHLSPQELHRGGSEVQSLAHSFEAMLARLLQAQTGLERMVAQRTDQLAQAKDRLDSILATLADGVYSLSIDRQELLFASPPVARLLGVGPDETPMVAATMQRLLDEDGRAALEAACITARQQGCAVACLAVRGDEHGPRWLENRMTLVRDACGRALRIDGILSDITATVRARERGEQATAGLRLRDQALASTGNGVLILEMAPGRARAVYANPAMAALSGASIEELLAADGELLRSRMLDEDIVHAMRGCVTGCHDVHLETRMRRADGSIIWCEISISPMVDPQAPLPAPGQRPWVHHVVLVIDDVTERRRQEAMHRRVIESVNEVIFQVDLGGHWTYLNPAWERITGRSGPDMLGRHFLEAILPADRGRAQLLFEAMVHGDAGSCRGEIRHLTADGGSRWLAVHAHRLLDDDGQPCGYSGTLSDVTEQREAEASLRLRDRAIDASTNGILLTDVQAPGNPLVFVNAGFTRVTGYAPSEVLGRSCSLLQGEDHDQPGLAEIREAIARGQPCRVLLRNYRRDGRRFDNDLSIAPVHDELTGEITHYIGIISDITARLEAQALLRDQLARLDTVFALSPDGFVSFDRQGHAMSLNPAFERLVGVPAAELLGLDRAAFDARLAGVIEARDPPGMAHWLSDLGEAGEAGCHAEVLVLRGPPQRVVVSSRRDCDAPSVSQVLHLRDITRETEVDRMKSEFLSTAAHELRTPMASIRGFSDLLLMRRFDEERTRDVLQTINRQSVWLTNMINELLDLARIEARKGKDFCLEVLDVRDIVTAGVEGLMVPGDERRIEQTLSALPMPVRVDRAKFQHAITNVLSNAYKYSPQGGRIELQTLQRQRQGRDRVGVVVRDHGIGMSPEHARRAFERFFRADASGNIPGTGLGLALVKEIVELHGGEVELDSVLGQGTSVTLWLPAWTTDVTAEPACA